MSDGARGWQRWLAPGALVLAGVSLALNLYLFGVLRHPERWAAPLLVRALGELEAEDARVRYEVRLPAGTPISLDIPVDERFTVTVDTVLPIDTRVRVPIETPFGRRSVVVPLRADVPVRAQLPLQIHHTFALRTTTGAEIVIPLELKIRDLPLDALRRSLAPE